MLNNQTKKVLNSDKVIVPLLLGMAFSLFFLNESVRTMVNEGKINSFYNLFFLIFGTVTIAVIMLSQFMDIGIVFLTCTFFGVAFFTVIYGGQHSLQISIISSMIMPFLLIGFRLPETAFKTFLETFLKIFNIVCFGLVACGIIDYLTGAGVQEYFAKYHIFGSDLARLALLERSFGIYRFYSILGHPLSNTWYLLVFYVLNILYNRYYRPLLNEYLLIIVTLIGLVLCGSRTGLLIGLFMGLFLNNIKHRAALLVGLSGLSAGLAMTPLFRENLLRRFLLGSTTGDFSEGRNEALTRVFKGFVKQPEFFVGGGISASRQITLNMGGLINSFEYPFMMFAYDFGILGTIIIYVIILAVPALILYKNRCYFLLAFFLGISTYLNGFNALANYSDSMGQFSVLIMIFLNMSYMIKRKRDSNTPQDNMEM